MTRMSPSPQSSRGSRRSRGAGVAPPIAIEHGRKLLGECAIFRDLDDAERAAFCARARFRAYAPDEIIFLKGSNGESMMVVLAGSVRISVPSPEGKEVVLAILPPGEVFGEIAIFDGKERTADATAVAACHLAILQRRDVFALLDHHPKIWPKLVKILCGRLRNSDGHVADLALHDLPIRLAKALLRMAGAEEGKIHSGQPLLVHLYQHELGSICGASRESVNKCLGLWQRRGIVDINEGLVMVANRTALQDLAQCEEC